MFLKWVDVLVVLRDFGEAFGWSQQIQCGTVMFSTSREQFDAPVRSKTTVKL